jgi:hypothetical protein
MGGSMVQTQKVGVSIFTLHHAHTKIFNNLKTGDVW